MSIDPPLADWERELLEEQAARMAEAEGLPAWVLDLVRGLVKYEDEHPKLYAQFAMHGSKWLQADCPGHLLKLIPPEVLTIVKRLRSAGDIRERVEP